MGKEKIDLNGGESVTKHFLGSLRIYLGPPLLEYIQILRVPPLSVSIVIHKQALSDLLASHPPWVLISIRGLSASAGGGGRPPAGLGLGDELGKVTVSVKSSLPLSPLPEAPPCLMYRQTPPLVPSCQPGFHYLLFSGWWAELGHRWDGGKKSSERGLSLPAQLPREPP